MSPANRFHIFVATLTITSMYWFLTRLSELVPNPDSLSPWQRAAIAYVSSAAFYQLCALGLRYVLDRWIWARGKVFGPDFVRGTWAGCYKTPQGENRITIEHIEQTLDGIIITGYAFTEQTDRPIIMWTSKAAAVNSNDGVLTYS